jgi:hypothetical protein
MNLKLTKAITIILLVSLILVWIFTRIFSNVNIANYGSAIIFILFIVLIIVDKIIYKRREEMNKFEPFDIVIYKPTGERGLVKRVTEDGVFVLFRIQSTAQLCKFEDLELE